MSVLSHTGTLLDRPEVIPDAERLMQHEGLRTRVSLLGASFFEPIAATGDLWILSQVLHDWPDVECRTILQRCRERMGAADRLLTVEMVPTPTRPNPEIAMMDLGMMTFAGEARQRTLDEYDVLFAIGTAACPRAANNEQLSIIEAHPV